MKRKILLVGWDAADWKVIGPLVDAGKMPHTARLVEAGTMGNLATLNPVLSPMLWTSIATGKRPYKHGIHGFSEPDPQSGGVRPITNLSRKTKTVWNILNQEGKKSIVTGWWPSSPAEPIRGAMVSNHFQQAVAPPDKPWPMRPGTVYPPELAKELGPLRLHPYDVEGDALRNFVPRAPEVDQETDKRLLTVAKIAAECASIQAAALHLLQKEPDWDFAAVYFDGIDHYGHAFMKYHPPRLDWVSEEDFAMYKGVVEGGYLHHDLMLGQLLEAAGPDTTVILMSDHGFHPDHLRPRSLPNEPAGPAAEHRQFGIFVAAGPGIKKDDLVFGASLLDVTPTILSLFDLPVGRDMDGRVLTSIWETEQEVSFIDSWDEVSGEDGRHPPETQIDPVDAKEAIRQLVDLGYIDELNENRETAVDETVRELRYNLARAHVDGGQLAEARALFAELWERWPEESRFGVHLLQAQLDDGLVIEARETMTQLRERKAAAVIRATEQFGEQLKELQKEQSEGEEATIEVGEEGIDWDLVDEQKKRRLNRLRSRARTNERAFAFLEGSLLHLEGRHVEALETLKEAASAQTSNLPSLYFKMGEVAVSMRDWEAAREFYGKVVEFDPLHAAAHLGLARVASHRQEWETVVNEAATAAGLHYHHPQAHYLGGRALWNLGRKEEAVASIRKAIAINPVYPAAHRTLSSWLLKEWQDWEGHMRHLALAREARRRIANQRAGIPKEAHPMEIRATFGETGSDSESDSDGALDLPPRSETVIVVSGLPRSGTSMAMQMLQAGGVPVLVDDHRPADASNERGYLELEAVKSIGTDRTWVGEAKGKAVKVIAQLVPSLPPDQAYRFLFMHRPLIDVVASQKKMLERLGKSGAKITDAALAETFERQLAQVRSILRQLKKNGVLDVLDLRYRDVVYDSKTMAEKIGEFLGGDFDVEAAAAAVDPGLQHEKR
ncbi:MAG: alkaline phosphatase family protein [Verrucomicrobiota bacterium]